jgi:DNA-binding CsgD family transcriptional regulator
MSAAIDIHHGWLASGERASRLAARCGSPGEDAAFARALATLSKRERQMLRLRAQGLTIMEISERCFLGDSTVKAHLHSAFRKLDLDDLRDRGKCARACYLLGRHDARVEEHVHSSP